MRRRATNAGPTARTADLAAYAPVIVTPAERDNSIGLPAPGPESERALRCVNCGYDLRGLPLPRACPECGEVSDPAREQAIAWFLDLRSWLYHGPPRAAAAHLHDPRVSRAACLRLGLVLTIPWLAALIVTLGAVVFVGALLLFAPYPPAERRRTTLALAAGYAPYVLAYPLIALLVLLSGRQSQPLWVMFVVGVVFVSQFAVMVWTIGTTSLLLPHGRPIARLTCVSVAGAWFLLQALPPLASLVSLR